MAIDEQLLAELQSLYDLAHQLKNTSIKSSKKSLADLLLLSQDFPSQYTVLYVYFSQQASTKHYQLLITFLKQAKAIEVHFADLILLHKEAKSPPSERLSLLVDNSLWAETLSGTGLLIYLDSLALYANGGIAKYILTDSQGMLISKFTPTDWQMLFKHTFLRYLFLTELQRFQPVLMRYLRLEAILPAAMKDSEIAICCLRFSPWLNEIGNQDFIDLITILDDRELEKLLVESETNQAFINKFALLLNESMTDRKYYFKRIKHTKSTPQLDCCLKSTALLSRLDNDAFKACIAAQGHVGKDFFKNTAFKTRLLQLDGAQLVQVVQASCSKYKFSYLASPILCDSDCIAKLSDNNHVAQILNCVSTEDEFVNILQKSLFINERFQGSVFIKFIEYGNANCRLFHPSINFDERLSNNDVLYLFTKANSKHLFVLLEPFQVDYFLNSRIEFLINLSDSQLQTMYEHCLYRSNVLEQVIAYNSQSVTLTAPLTQDSITNAPPQQVLVSQDNNVANNSNCDLSIQQSNDIHCDEAFSSQNKYNKIAIFLSDWMLVLIPILLTAALIISLSLAGPPILSFILGELAVIGLLGASYDFIYYSGKGNKQDNLSSSVKLSAKPIHAEQGATNFTPAPHPALTVPCYPSPLYSPRAKTANSTNSKASPSSSTFPGSQ